MPGTFSPPPRVKRSRHASRHVPWCMPGSLTSGFLWSRWRGKRSRHPRCMCSPQLYVSGKRPMKTENRHDGMHADGYLHKKKTFLLTANILNTLKPRQNGRRFADDTFKRFFLNENARISIKISLKFVPMGPIDNNPALVQIMAWCRSGDKPLSEPMMISLPTHISVTRPQWVNCKSDLINIGNIDIKEISCTAAHQALVIRNLAYSYTG